LRRSPRDGGPAVRIVHVLSRFPRAELAIHRLYASDPTFRGICDDYEEAVVALCHWEHDETRAEDFRRLAAEIEVDIAALLEERGAVRRPAD
jgi:hypothetical protein